MPVTIDPPSRLARAARDRASQVRLEEANQQLRTALPGVPVFIETERYERGLFATHARHVLKLRPRVAPGGIGSGQGASSGLAPGGIARAGVAPR